MAIDKKTGKAYESTVRATIAWAKTHVRQIKMNMNIETDAEILAKLDSVPNKTDYIRQLVLADIAQERKEG